MLLGMVACQYYNHNISRRLLFVSDAPALGAPSLITYSLFFSPGGFTISSFLGSSLSLLPGQPNSSYVHLYLSLYLPLNPFMT